MALTAQQIEEQKKQAEELLFSEEEKLGFAKSLFFGEYKGALLTPYPELKPQERLEVERTLSELRHFLANDVDSAAIDRDADIPKHVVDGLARIGVLGMTVPKEYGGRGFSQLANTKILETIGAQDSSIAVFVNAHHSIGVRALLLFGTDEQKRRWLPEMAAGKALGAFALTERE